MSDHEPVPEAGANCAKSYQYCDDFAALIDGNS